MTAGRRLLAMAAIVVGGCASPVPTNAPIQSFPADAVVFRVVDTTFFPQAPGLEVAGEPPAITVYGDGRVIRVSTEPVFVVTQVAELLEARIEPATLSALVDLAERQGLVRTVLFECRGLFDASTTTLETTLGGMTSRYEAFGLGFDSCEDMRPDEVAGRQNLEAFIEVLRSMNGERRVGPYVPERVVLVVAERPTDVAPTLVSWPLGGDLATFGDAAPADSGWERCGVLAQDDVARVWPLLRQATQTTRFVSGGTEYWVDAQPLLPGEAGACPVAQ